MIEDKGMQFEPNETELIVALLKKFGESVSKDSSYAPDCVTYPIMLNITNAILAKFDEDEIDMKAVKS